MNLTLSPDEMAVIKLSYQIASVSLLVNLLPAIAMGWLLARKDFFGKSLFETLVFLPLVLPPVVPGYILLVLFGNQGVISWGLIWHLIGKERYWHQRSWAFP